MKPTVEDAVKAHQALLDVYGDHAWHSRDPVATLVNTILSQNTNDVNRDTAYSRLRSRFPTWDDVRDAPEKELVDAIRPAGLGPTKAPRIQTALRRVTEREGEISLDFLQHASTEDARQWLTDLPGVGPKTAAIVLCFALGKPAFPVDTHVHRVTGRLGLIPKGTNRAKAHDVLQDIVPEELYYSFHLNLIAHGRAVCHSRKPECERCILQADCDYYEHVRRESTN
ncbi:MAG: endonuclease III [Anaerolineae bacterium]|jgi:endonuclease-3